MLRRAVLRLAFRASSVRERWTSSSRATLLRSPPLLSHTWLCGRALSGSSADVTVRPNRKFGGKLNFEQPYFECKKKSWDDMWVGHRQNWQILGWTEIAWDSDDPELWPPTAFADWKDLTERERSAAYALGYDEILWEEDEGEVWRLCESQTWEDLQPGHRLAFQTLGWNKFSWKKRAEPPSYQKAFNELSRPECEAAVRLGFTTESWVGGANKPLWFRWGIAASVLGFCLYQFLSSGSQRKYKFDQQQDQVHARHMWRISVAERTEWRRRCEEIGFLFHSAAGIRWSPEWQGSWGLQDAYWGEGYAYVFSSEAESQLRHASWELHNMCLQAVDRVVGDDRLMDLFEIPAQLRQAVRVSWSQRQPDLIGRFDLMFDGSEPPKLLEYNGDTPTLLVESSLAQAQWKRDRESSLSGYGQFNALEDNLVSSWQTFLTRSAKAVGVSGLPEILFAAQRASLEERCNIDYLADTARRAGLAARTIELSDLHTDELGHLWEMPGSRLSESEALSDDQRKRVEAVWKLYPYEWLAEEELGHALDWGDQTPGEVWAEPPWKIVLANKSILALLWEMFPDHPNLLPAFFTIGDAIAYENTNKPTGEEWGWVSKPRFGREGIGVRYSFDSPSLPIFDEKVREELRTLESSSQQYDASILKHLDQMGRSALGLGKGDALDARQHNIMEAREHEAAIRGDATMRGDLPFPPIGGPIFQLYQDTDIFMGRRAVLGSWIVFGNPSGICVREDIQNTTNNDSCFVPHIIDREATADLTVTQKGVNRGQVDFSGTYSLTGRLRDAGVYFCSANGLYLMKNADKEWMFTAHESGGSDGMLGLAACYKTTIDATIDALAGEAWYSADGTMIPSGNIIVSRSIRSTGGSSVKASDDECTLSGEQAWLRSELYGMPGGKVNAQGSSAHSEHRGGGGYYGRTYTGGSSGGWFGNRYWASSQQTQQQQQHTQQQQQQQQQQRAERHGRKSGNKWKEYGRKAATGTYGRSMGNLGHSGGGAS